MVVYQGIVTILSHPGPTPIHFRYIFSEPDIFLAIVRKSFVQGYFLDGIPIQKEPCT